MTDNPKSAYVAKDIERAKAELAKQTPENWIELQRYIQTMEQKWPEAPCSVNFRVDYPGGQNAQWTLRDFDDDLLAIRLDKLFVSLDESGCKPETKGYKPPTSFGELASTKVATPTQPASPEDLVITTPGVTRDALVAGGFDSFPVELVTHMVTQGKAIPHLVIKGGNFMQYGFKAWQEVVPEGLDWNEFPIGKELPAPPSMRIAYLSKGDSQGKNRKVIAFLGEA